MIQKTYLTYQKRAVLGALCGYKSNIAYSGNTFFTSMNNQLLCISSKTNQVIGTYTYCEDSQVTTFTLSNNQLQIAVGFSDGSVNILDAQSLDVAFKFSAHKSPVNTIIFAQSDTIVYSGSDDTSIVAYDLISNTSLYKLCGHSNSITALKFYSFGHQELLPNQNILISCSKDSLIKIWDTKTQKSLQVISDCNDIIHCVELIENQLLIEQPGKILVYELRISKSEENSKVYSFCTKSGEVAKKSSAYALCLKFVDSHKLLLVLNNDSTLEVFKIANQKDVVKKMLRPKKRKLLAAKNKEDADPNQITEIEQEIAKQKTKLIKALNSNSLDKGLFYHFILTTKLSIVKPVSFDIEFQTTLNAKIITAMNNNSVEIHSLTIKEEGALQILEDMAKFITSKTVAVVPLYSIDSWVHHSPIKLCAISDDDSMFATSCSAQIKLWNVETLRCVHSIPTTDACCMSFLPSNNYLVAGYKTGIMCLIEASTGSIIWEGKAHDKEVASIDVCTSPDIKSVEMCILTCSSDRTLKLWIFNTKKSKKVTISLECLNTIQTTDDALFAKFTPNGKYIAFALADNTIKIIFADTFKLSLSLYGHKLPASVFDISSDNALLASGGADKNIRIWGMDFGDCHKSMFLFEDTITTIKFVKDTHFIIAGSKDGTIKHIDADRFVTICVITKHFGEVWGIALSSIGDEMFSVSSDKTIQIWKQTQEPMIAEDNYDQIENEMVEDADQVLGEYYNPFEKVDEKSIVPFKATKEKLDASSVLSEAIIKVEEMRLLIEQHQIALDSKIKQEKPKVPAELQNTTLHQYIYSKLKQIPSADIENVLRFVPPTYLLKLIYYLCPLLDVDFDLTLKCVTYIYNECYQQIVSTPSVSSLAKKLYERATSKLNIMRDVIGTNIFATSLMMKGKKNAHVDDFKVRQSLL